MGAEGVNCGRAFSLVERKYASVTNATKQNTHIARDLVAGSRRALFARVAHFRSQDFRPRLRRQRETTVPTHGRDSLETGWRRWIPSTARRLTTRSAERGKKAIMHKGLGRNRVTHGPDSAHRARVPATRVGTSFRKTDTASPSHVTPEGPANRKARNRARSRDGGT